MTHQRGSPAAMLQSRQCSSWGRQRMRGCSSSLGSLATSRPVTLRHLGQRRRSLHVQASAAAAAVPGPEASNKHPFWSPKWWDVGQSENDKNRQPGKLSDTLGMAWQLIAQEKKLMGAASFLMVGLGPVTSLGRCRRPCVWHTRGQMPGRCRPRRHDELGWQRLGVLSARTAKPQHTHHARTLSSMSHVMEES